MSPKLHRAEKEQPKTTKFSDMISLPLSSLKQSLNLSQFSNPEDQLNSIVEYTKIDTKIETIYCRVYNQQDFGVPQCNLGEVFIDYLRQYAIRKNNKNVALLLLSVSLKAQMVYETPSGAKYHLATCRMVKNVSEQVTVKNARELGLQPCKTYRPQNIYLSSSSLPNKAQGQGVTAQCKGITKNGIRCKHMTRIALEIAFNINLDKSSSFLLIFFRRPYS